MYKPSVVVQAMALFKVVNSTFHFWLQLMSYGISVPQPRPQQRQHQIFTTRPPEDFEQHFWTSFEKGVFRRLANCHLLSKPQHLQIIYIRKTDSILQRKKVWLPNWPDLGIYGLRKSPVT